MSEERKILPCPFCGSTAITIEWEPCAPLDEGDTTRRWFAECTQCSCQGPFCQKEPQVIPAWNKRAPTVLDGAGQDLESCAKTLIKHRHTAPEWMWENLANSANRLDATRQATQP